MTVIVGLEHKGCVYIGGDSAGVAGMQMNIREDKKVFETGEYIIGCTTSFRMIDLLKYKLHVNKQEDYVDDIRFMATTFIDSVIECFAQNGFGKRSDNDGYEGGSFLVGYRGKLYSIADDFQVGISAHKYNAVGCGAEIAKGAMFACKIADPVKRINVALEAASTFSAGVRPPFHVVMQRAGE